MATQIMPQATTTNPKSCFWPHLFEFMDLDWLPMGLRNTMREILECGNARPFRPYYDGAVTAIVEHANSLHVNHIVELGAGTAPLTRRLAHDDRCSAKLTICDANPDREAYQELEKRFPDKVTAVYEPVDFSKPHSWPDRTLLVLSATLHHLPGEARQQALSAMARSAEAVLIIEPLRRTISSLLFVVGSAVPAILLPLLFLGRSGTLRRLFWCWLFPVAPVVFLWDGWISCLRQWPDQNYREWAKSNGVDADVRHSLFSQIVSLQQR